jgi:bacillithiol biosynthesis cysteine-adding enzyme BshC
LLRFVSMPHSQRHQIASRYISNTDQLTHRFDYAYPTATSIWHERAQWLDGAKRRVASRDQLVAALRAYNGLHNHHPQVMSAIENLLDSRTLVVSSGQQPCLFTGPALVIHKAISCIQLARQLTMKLNRPIVPVFWIAGEDHDWDEVNHTYVLTSEAKIEKVSIPHPAGSYSKRTSIGQTAITNEQWEQVLSAFSSILPETEFKPNIHKELQRICMESTNLVDAFAKIMSLLFGHHGLILLHSDDQSLRMIESPMFSELIMKHEQLSQALEVGENSVSESGFSLQAPAQTNSLNLFLYVHDERKLLFTQGSHIVDRKGSLHLTYEQLLHIAHHSPASLSNNALTRPLMQEYLLPSIATILGPSEIAYWSTLRESFHLFGMRQPVIIPRIEVTLIEGTISKLLNKYELTVPDIYERWSEKRELWLQKQDALGINKAFAELREAFNEMYRPIIQSAGLINPGLQQLGETNRTKIFEQTSYFEAKMLDALQLQHEAGMRHWERIRLSIYPKEKPQERVLNIFQYIAKYGFAFLDDLMNHWVELEEQPKHPHYVVHL